MRYSQSDEDDIIRDIFQSIGTTNKKFIEVGCGSGKINNTIALLLDGWSGKWFEPNGRRFKIACGRWKDYPVEIRRRKITPEKVNLVVKDPLDFLSIDIDGLDFEVWDACTAKPRLVCIESVERKDWEGQAQRKGYRLVAKSAYDINSFYVRDDA